MIGVAVLLNQPEADALLSGWQRRWGNCVCNASALDGVEPGNLLVPVPSVEVRSGGVKEMKVGGKEVLLSFSKFVVH